jgi:hypothetical protein
MLFWLSKDEKELLFINKNHWQVSVKATQNEVYVNGYMFPKNRQEIALANGYVLLKFPLNEVHIYD